jgi:RNA methyltransferase, TrmH family
MRTAMRSPERALCSRGNPLVKRLASLKRRAGADAELMLIEGPKLLGEALDARLAVVEVVVSASRLADEALAPLLSRLAGTGIRARAVEDRLLASLSEVETSQGLLALARRPAIDADAALPGISLLLVAVGIQNPGNLGGLLRTAEAAGATGAWLTDGCADPYSWKSLRGSMGSAFRLPVRRGVATADLMAALRARGLRTLAADAAAPLRYDAADLSGPLALLVGSEGTGLPEELARAADLRVSIPLLPPVESLNVGVAAGVLLFEAARQRRRPDPGA